jgi:hypothetical protein
MPEQEKVPMMEASRYGYVTATSPPAQEEVEMTEMGASTCDYELSLRLLKKKKQEASKYETPLHPRPLPHEQ